MKLKHSIGQLALAVLACGVAIRAVTSPSRLWAAVVLSTALAACTLALVGALYARGPRRASCGGAAACGWIYLLVALGPWSREQVGPHLATGAAIDLLFGAVRSFDPTWDVMKLQQAQQDLEAEMQRMSKLAGGLQNDPGIVQPDGKWMGGIQLKGDWMEVLQSRAEQLRVLRERYEADTAEDPGNRWAAWTRPAWISSNGGPASAWDTFQRIGHGLFAIAFALAGGAFGRFMAKPDPAEGGLPGHPPAG
jgi:hypothetical protein